MRKRTSFLQFGVRSLLLLLLFASFGSFYLARRLHRPDYLHVVIDPSGSMAIDGKLITKDRTGDFFKAQIERFRDYDVAGAMVVEAHPTTKQGQILDLIDAAQAAGFERFTFKASDDPGAPRGR